jgi:hypothetical protein
MVTQQLETLYEQEEGWLWLGYEMKKRGGNTPRMRRSFVPSFPVSPSRCEACTSHLPGLYQLVSEKNKSASTRKAINPCRDSYQYMCVGLP